MNNKFLIFSLFTVFATSMHSEKISKVKKSKSVKKSTVYDSLKRSLEHGYKRSSEIREKESSLEATNNDVSIATSGWRPIIQGTASHNVQSQIINGDQKRNNLGASARSNSKRNRAGITVQQNIFQGGETVAATNTAEANVQAARYDLINTEQNILFQVIQVYLDLWKKTSQEKLLNSDKNALLETLNAAREKFDLGAETRTNVAEAEKKYATGLSELERVRVEIVQLRATYNRLTGLGEISIVKPREISSYVPEVSEITDEKNMDIAIKKLTEYVKKNNPSIYKSRAEMDSARFSIDRARSAYLPKIDLSASASHSTTREKGRRYDPRRINFNSSRNRQAAYEGGVTVTVPLYNQGRTGAESRKARKILELRRVSLRTSTEKAVELAIQSWKNFVSGLVIIENVKKEVRASEVALEGAREEMNVGSKILLDVLQAQRDLLSAKLRLVEARSSYYLSGFRMLNAMGLLTSRNLNLNVKHYDPSVHYNDVRNRWAIPEGSQKTSSYNDNVLK